MEEIPSKPYLIRALYEWCADNGYTPYIIVNVGADTRVPRAHVRDGQITFNISSLATQHLVIDNSHITFQARFGGMTEHIFVPTSAVIAIYARETGAGMGFEQIQVAAQPDGKADGKATDANQSNNTRNTSASKPYPDDPVPPGPPRRPKLTIVK